MIKQIGSIYNKVELVKDRMYVKINGEDYVIENEWVNITYQVTKKGDKIVLSVITSPNDNNPCTNGKLYP